MDGFAKYQAPFSAPQGVFQWLAGWVLALFAALFYGTSVLIINLLQILSLLVRPVSKIAFRRFNTYVAGLWWGWCVSGSENVLGVHPIFTGDDVPPGENAILFANHQQMPDILAIMMLAYRKGRLDDMKWFVKQPLKYVPGIGWGMQFLDCLFVKRDWAADKTRITATFSKFLGDRIPIWLITFVEGTRITAAKREKSREQAARKGLPVLDHVLTPRTRGFSAAVDGLREHVQAVYDITIGYEGGVPRLHHIMRGQVRRIHIDVRRFAIGDLPMGELEMASWLRERFERKDRLLAELYKSGGFPSQM